VYGEDFQLVELPYKGDKYCADIVLPAKDTDIRAWLKKLNAEKWQQMLAKAYKTELSVTLPKFSLNYNRTLNEDLQALGMKDAFGRQADFSRLSEIPAFISLIKQYTFLQVDEEGTEAAAVTIGLMDKNAASMGFVADRPFLFVIREREQGTILFTALIGHPEWQNN
jgi:serpin B